MVVESSFVLLCKPLDFARPNIHLQVLALNSVYIVQDFSVIKFTTLGTFEFLGYYTLIFYLLN